MSDSSLLPFNPAFPILMTILHRKGLCCHSTIKRDGFSPSRLLSCQGSQPCPTHIYLTFGRNESHDKISIVDLHPNQMMFPGPIWSKQVHSEHCCIEYFYRSMVDLTCFEATSFDLIWSGESIEHVTVEDAESIISQAYKLLKPGGKLALDTPNRLATQLISPGAYTHPEHKIEYDYETLCKLLKKHNFNIIESKGMIDLSQSIKDNKCSNFYNEFMQRSSLNDNPETSYCFYICCVKPDD